LEDPSDAETFKIVDANRAAAEITRSDSQSLLGKRLADFPKLLKTQFLGNCSQRFERDTLATWGEVSYRDDHGREGIYSVRAFPFPIMPRRRLLKMSLIAAYGTHPPDSEERLRLLIEDVQEYAIFQLDPDGNVVSWNAGAQRLRDMIRRKSSESISLFSIRKKISATTSHAKYLPGLRNWPAQDEGWRIRKDGSRFWANVVVTALRDPRAIFSASPKLTRTSLKNVRKPKP